jgi:hypothetical protein
MRRFTIIDKFAEWTPFRGCDSHKREFETLGVLILGVEFVDIELPTAGTEGHGFCKSESLQVSKIKHNDELVMKKKKRWDEEMSLKWCGTVASRLLHLPQVHSTPALCHRGAGYAL